MSIFRDPVYWTLLERRNGKVLRFYLELGGREASKELFPVRSSHERFMSVSQEETSGFQLAQADHPPSLQVIGH